MENNNKKMPKKFFSLEILRIYYSIQKSIIYLILIFSMSIIL